MNLKTYLTSTGTKQAEFAASLGVKASHVSLLVSGMRKPSRQIAVKIEQMTQGNVPASSWDEDLPAAS